MKCIGYEKFIKNTNISYHKETDTQKKVKVKKK